ncbi:MAG TPA: DUF4175 family protein [Gemmatimonadaceae bacterium]|jgi:hypothetical protein|nr:DUF4175 family protein [Gemmatimonadaceae bacterium]
MTTLERVRRARRRLAGTVVVAALLWTAALAVAVVVVAALVNTIAPLPLFARVILIPLAAVAALTAGGVTLWRGRAALSMEHVALWVEEREPRLRYALVTSIDPAIAPAAQHTELHAFAGEADVEGVVRRASRRALGLALIAVVLAGVAIAILRPRELLRAAGRDLARRAGSRPAAPMANRLAKLSARVDAPAYARLPSVTLKEPTSVPALIGSRVAFSGSGPAEGLSATIGKDSGVMLAAVKEGHDWAVRVTMPKEPTVLTLRDRAYRRLVVLEPITDSAPTVKLRLPEHDTTYQTVPKGKLQLEGELTDDIGLAYGYFEFMLSTGSEESFETMASTGPRVPFDNARTATLRATLDLDTMKLAPGSVLHIRAVAFDFNDVTGPGKGISETRTLKIAEPVDSTSINAAPPLPIDSMWVSQRLLNMRTDTLIRTRRRLAREEMVHRSSAYSNLQEDIRKRALAVVVLLEDNGVGGSFQTEASKMLREAADLMWTAREDLGIAQPDSAMPYMKKILKILDDLRLAHRYYLRGLLKPVTVNIERVRMTGTDTAAAAARKPRDELPDPNAALAVRIDRAMAISHRTPAAALDSLTYIRVTAISSAPAVAKALGDAIALLQRGSSVDSALTGTRRALEPRPRIVSGPLEWGGVTP